MTESDTNSLESLAAYRIMAVAPFGGKNGGLRSAVELDRNKRDDPLAGTMAGIEPSIEVLLPKEFCPDGRVALQPETIDDFSPQAIVQKVPYLTALCGAIDLVRRAGQDGTSQERLREEVAAMLPGLELDFSDEEEDADVLPASTSSSGGGALDDLFSLVDVGGSGAGADGGSAGRDAFGKLRMQLESTARQVMQRLVRSSEFRETEAAWRGVALMLRDQCRQAPVHSVHYTLVSSDEEALPGLLEELRSTRAEKLPNMLLLDVMLQNTPSGLDLFERILETADMLMIPVALSGGPDFFGLDGWEGLDRLSYLPNYIDNAYFARWRKLGKHAGGAWTSVLVNRLPSRPLLDGDDTVVCGVSFREREQPWFNPVWALGALEAMSAGAAAWPVHACDRRRFVLENMVLRDNEPEPLETLFPDVRLDEFMRIGFTPLAAARRDDTVFLPGIVSVNGKSLVFNMFFSMLLGFLFRLRERIEAGEYSGSEEEIRDLLGSFLTRGGDEPPDDLDVSFLDNTESGTRVLSIGFTPPRGLVSSDRVEFTLGW